MRIKLKLVKRQLSLAALVASDDDLLTQILLHLPVKSLVRFKCVSKHWLSLITSFYFTKLRIRHSVPASCLLLHRSWHFINPEHDFVAFDTENPSKPPFSKLTLADDPSGIRILQSCNGLLFCCSFPGFEPRPNYYVYNPTTEQFTTIPNLGGTESVLNIHGMGFAYDPSKSTHYKVVCVRGYELMSWHYKSSCYYQIDVYSSETRQWRLNRQTNRSRRDIVFDQYQVVYWNGAIHWGCGGEHSPYFDVDQEKIGKMPVRPYFSGWEDSRIEYFGESGNHLHLIEVNRRQPTLLNIYEMERDRTRWLFRYHVNLDEVLTAFPNTIRHYLPPTDYHSFPMFVLCLIRGEREEDSFMVLHIPGKAIRYNVVDKSFHKLCDFAPQDLPYATDLEDEIADTSLQFPWLGAFQHIESHCIF